MEFATKKKKIQISRGRGRALAVLVGDRDVLATGAKFVLLDFAERVLVRHLERVPDVLRHVALVLEEFLQSHEEILKD
jgi:hypothetical protein